jgi:hypothetical protein
MTLQLFSEKNQNEPKIKTLETKTVMAVFNDFEPYRKQRSQAK